MGWLQSTPTNFTPLDIESIESAKTPYEVRANTRKLLSEAAGILETSSTMPEAKDKFVWDYNWVTESYSQWYTSQKQETWGALQKLKSAANTEQRNINYVLGLIEEWFTNTEYDWWLVKPTAENVKFTEIFYKEPYFWKILKYFDDNPDKVEIFVTNDLDLSMLCTSQEAVEKAELLSALLKEKYLESKNIQVSQNLENYFLNQTEIPDNKKWVFKDKVNELRNIGAFEALSKELKSWECSLDYIEIIKDFNGLHFWSLWINLKFTQEDAQSIIGSVIIVKRTENLVETLGINEQIINLTWIRKKELDDAIKSQNPAKSIWFLLAPYYAKYPKLLELEGQLFEQLDIKREIEQQEVRAEEVIKHSQAIYDMDDKERAELKQVLMSSDPDEIDELVAEKIDEITTRPENISTPSNPRNTSSPEFYSPIIQRVEKWENGIYIFPSSAWKIPITMDDLNALDNNPEAEANLINLYTNFLDTWLERLWPHKDAIFKSLWNNWGFKFNSQDWWYVDKTEANVLFSTILYVTTENINYKETGLSLEETKADIIRETHWITGETNIEVTWKQGNKIEKSFIDKFTMRKYGDEWRFNYTAFHKALKWDFSPNPQ